MSVSVGELLGQSVTSTQDIIPYDLTRGIPTCPFTHSECTKLKKETNKTEPVCSVISSGRLYPVCENRVLPSLKDATNQEFRGQLYNIAKTLFPNCSHQDLKFGLQQSITIGRSESGKKDVVRTDFAFRVTDPEYPNTSRAILEVQAGGETSSTNQLTQHVKSWRLERFPTNEMLRLPVKRPGLIPNNAWKRTLEQILRKGPLAVKFGGGLAVALGTINFDYFTRFIRNGSPIYPNWELALVEMKDNWPNDSIRFQPGRVVFFSFEEVIDSLRSYPYDPDLPDPFANVNLDF